MITVPENKIAVIPVIGDSHLQPFSFDNLSEIIVPAKNNKKRDWFTKHFYKCLPLAIANMQGFLVSVPFNFSVMWNGGSGTQDLFFSSGEDEKQYNDKKHLRVLSHFGHGIFTLDLPFMLKTPPGINLMIISPPNIVSYGLNCMSGVIESDNLRQLFTINIKVNVINEWIDIPSGYPLACIIPIPRYFCDSFDLVSADDLFIKDEIDEEQLICREHEIVRNFLRESGINEGLDRSYYFGEDIRGNKFSDHQLPKI